MKEIICSISDVHGCNGGPKDDFTGEDALIATLKDITFDILVLNGDFWEGWQCTLEEFMERYKKMMDFLRCLDPYHVRGNHDEEVKDTPIFEKTCEQVILGDVLFRHGHQSDQLNSRFDFVGRWATGIGGWLEKHIHKDADLLLIKLWSKIRGVGRYGNDLDYMKAGREYMKGFEGVNRIVEGHTHRKIITPDYINTGAWVNGKMDYVLLEIN